MKNGDEKKERVVDGRNLIDLVFSWSITDILNNCFYKNQVKQIPKTFSSTTEYLNSFTTPLLEEIHADLSSSVKSVSHHSLCRQAQSVRRSKDFKRPKDFFYDIVLRPSGTENEANKKSPLYEPQSGDLIAITGVRPNRIGDLERSFVVAYVQWVKDDGVSLSVLLSSLLDDDDSDDGRGSWKHVNLFATQMINMTTNVRIWQALTSNPKERNMRVIDKVLQPQFLVEGKCPICCDEQSERDSCSEMKIMVETSELNESQRSAVLSCVGSGDCGHRSSVKLIWGPPGTGKTKTVSFLLHSLLGMKCRTLTCAPTNIAILEVTERLVKKAIESSQYGTYGLGDIVLFGNEERMKIEDREELCDVFLDHRIDVLDHCFGSEIGWTKSLISIISLLEDPEKQHCLYLQDKEAKSWVRSDTDEGGDEKVYEDKERKKAMKQAILKSMKEKKNPETPKKEAKEKNAEKEKKDLDLSFMEFLKRRISLIAERIYTCTVALCTHLPTSILSPEVAKTMFAAAESLKSFQKSLRSALGEEFEKVFGDDVMGNENRFRDCRVARMKTLFFLKLLPTSFPVPHSANSFAERKEISNFFLANACLIFCTVSSSAKLHTKGMVPLEYLVIDEAAQLKECESAIPLQLLGVCHAVFIGDERQLPAMVKSKILEEAGFGRSLFERLASLGHKKHLLNVQHRMHPSISSFPNREFYANKIFDGPNVRVRSYNKIFLPGKMFGTYSFLNVAHGNELAGNNFSTKNMVEASVISEIIASLYKEAKSKKKKVRVGVISPYKAQVHTINERLGKQYSSDPQSDFSVSIRSVDGFQGGEEDVIIISTVRSNDNGSLGFLSNLQRTNVGLTRARHCLWIVGNGETLSKNRSVWKNLVNDAKQRRFFHNAEEDKNLAQAIISSLVETNQFKVSSNLHMHLFKEAKWKVQFDDALWASIARAKDYNLCNEVLSLLDKLSCGWRQVENEDEKIRSKCLECYKVKQMYLLWAVDTLREALHQTQVIKVYTIVGLHDLPRISKQLECLYERYTSDKMNRCKYKHREEGLVVPMRWAVESDSDEAHPVEILSESLALLRLRTKAETLRSSTSFRARGLSKFRTRRHDID